MAKVLLTALSLFRAVKSRTTQNQLGGVGIALTVLLWLRQQFPDWVTWDGASDEVLAGVITTIVGTLLSRIAAFARNPDKVKRSKRMLGLLLVAALSLAGVQGCVATRTMPDGSVVTVEVDGAELDALLDRLDRYIAAHDAAQARQDAEAQARLDRRIQAVRQAIEGLRVSSEVR